jgi:hypothetical protein
MIEQKENLRKAEESLRDAEKRILLVKKWEQAFPQVMLEYRASTRRIKDLASGDVPRASLVLGRMIDALESYLRVSPPTVSTAPAPLSTIVGNVLDRATSEEEEVDANANANAEADLNATIATGDDEAGPALDSDRTGDSPPTPKASD